MDSQKIIEGSTAYLTVSCVNWVCPTFSGGGSEDVGKLVYYLRAIWIDWFVQSLLGGLCSCHWSDFLLPQCFPCSSIIGEKCLGISYPCLLVLSSPDGEGLDGIYSLLSDGITFLAVCPSFLRGRDN